MSQTTTTICDRCGARVDEDHTEDPISPPNYVRVHAFSFLTLMAGDDFNRDYCVDCWPDIENGLKEVLPQRRVLCLDCDDRKCSGCGTVHVEVESWKGINP